MPSPPRSLHRTLGSLAFASSARSVLLLHSLPPQARRFQRRGDDRFSLSDNSSIENQKSNLEIPHTQSSALQHSSTILPHLYLSLKSNLTQSPLPLSPHTIEGTITYHPEQSLPPPPPKSRGPAALSRFEAAATMAPKRPHDGPLLAAQLTDDAYANAISRSTLDRAFRQLANMSNPSSKTIPAAGSQWQLPGDSRPLPEDLDGKTINFQLFHPQGGRT